MKNKSNRYQPEKSSALPINPQSQTVNHESSDQTNTVNTVANECHPAETGAKNTVQTHAERSPIKRGKRAYKKRKVDVTQWQTSTCEYCGDEMIVKRSTGPKRKRFCSVQCRVAAHRAKHGQGAANDQ